MIRPDDWHCHLRDGEKLQKTPINTAKNFARAIIMPNLKPPVTTVDAAISYKQRIKSHLGPQTDFTPLMTLYLTNETSAEEIKKAKNSGEITAFKLYPAGVTTNSAAGVRDIEALFPQLKVMEECNLPLCIHGESPDPNLDIFDREKDFIDRYLIKIVQEFSSLRIILEHISTAHAVQFVQEMSENLAATITIHHLLFNRNDLLSGGIKPHHYCLPILKRSTDQEMLKNAAISGNPKFFLGTDSAPHAIDDKQSACGCAGIYSAPVALPLYTQFFEQHGALDKLENFASRFGPAFYQLPVNTQTITLEKKPWRVPERMILGDCEVVPLLAGQEIQWQVIE